MIAKTTIGFINTTAFLFLGITSSSLHAPRAAAQNTVKIDGTMNTVKIDATTNTVKAVQSGTWNVGISGTPSVTLSGPVSLAAGSAVQIGNSTSSPALFRNVDRPIAQPVRANLSATFAANFAASTVGNIYTVPGGKRLVVEFVTVNITVPNGQSAQFARLDSTGFNQYLALTPSGSDATNKPVFIGTHRMFAIFEPGIIVEAFGTRNSGTGTGTITMTIAGYLVDI